MQHRAFCMLIHFFLVKVDMLMIIIQHYFLRAKLKRYYLCQFCTSCGVYLLCKRTYLSWGVVSICNEYFLFCYLITLFLLMKIDVRTSRLTILYSIAFLEHESKVLCLYFPNELANSPSPLVR